MDKQCEKKLKTMQKGDLFCLKQILQIIYDILISHNRKPYWNNFFEMKYFEGLPPLKVRRILALLDDEFKIISYQQRDVDRAIDLKLKTMDDSSAFLEFKKMIDTVYAGKDFINKMTFVDPEEKRFKVIINDDYSNIWLADKIKKYWELLALVALKGAAPKTEYKNAYDQINARERTPFKDSHLYSQILKSENGKITSNIEMEIITDREYRKKKTDSEF